MPKKIYRSNLTILQRKQYDILVSRGVSITPRAIRQIFKSISKANKAVAKTKDTLAEQKTLTKDFAKFVHNQNEYRKFLKRISQRLHITEQQIIDISNYNRDKLISKVKDVVGSDLGLSKLTNDEIATLLKDPAYRRFKVFMYGDTDPKSSQASQDKNIEMYQEWANTKGDLQAVIQDIASYRKGWYYFKV